MPTITSAHNATFKKYLSLTSAKGLKKEGLLLLSGAKLISEFLARPHLAIMAEIITKAMTPLTKNDAAVFHLTPDLFDQLDVLGTHHNLLALEQPAIATLDASALPSYRPEGIEVVLPTGDPGNLGALIRSCEAFSVPRVLLTREAAHPFLPKAIKASAGSALRVAMMDAPALAEFPDSCIALAIDGVPLRDFVWPPDGLLVVGEEGPGLGRSFRQRVRIPTRGVESLNVVVAASIALAHQAETSFKQP